MFPLATPVYSLCLVRNIPRDSPPGIGVGVWEVPADVGMFGRLGAGPSPEPEVRTSPQWGRWGSSLRDGSPIRGRCFQIQACMTSQSLHLVYCRPDIATQTQLQPHQPVSRAYAHTKPCPTFHSRARHHGRVFLLFLHYVYRAQFFYSAFLHCAGWLILVTYGCRNLPLRLGLDEKAAPMAEQ